MSGGSGNPGRGTALSWWEWLCTLLVAGVFGYAGVVKLLHVDDFAHIIARFELLPVALINPLALVLPAVEVLLAVALFVPMWRRAAWLGMVVACGVFAAVLMSAIGRGIPVECGCFGSGEKPSIHGAWWALGRDVVLLVIAVLCYARHSSDLHLSGNGGPSSPFDPPPGQKPCSAPPTSVGAGS